MWGCQLVNGKAGFALLSAGSQCGTDSTMPRSCSSWLWTEFSFCLVVVQLLSHVWLFDTPWTAAQQASRPSQSPRVCSNSRPLSQWCPPTISSSASLFFFCLQSFPAAGSFPMSCLFASGGQSIGASASVLPMTIHGWLPLELTGLISLLSKGLSRVFSRTTIWKHQFFGAQPSSRSILHPYIPFVSIYSYQVSLKHRHSILISSSSFLGFFAIWLFKRQSAGRNYPSHTLRAVKPPWLVRPEEIVIL